MNHDSQSDHPEGIHLPSPSPAPIMVAGGMALIAVGLLAPPFAIMGVLLLVGGIALWAFGPQ